ncbi:MAG: sulfatase-like hydrolase/transferase [Spirochaetales bacterium]|nr:sulfatase-like hydrolase/transferase [Spirochaetales bacterium]
MINLDGFRADAIAHAPCLESLKQSSCFFSCAFTYAPYTVASLPAVMTGLYGRSNGVNAYYRSNRFDSGNCFTMAQYFKQKGCHTRADIVNRHVIPSPGFDSIMIHDENKDDFIDRHCGIIREVSLCKKPFFIFFQYSPIHARLVRDVIDRYDDFSDEYFDRENRNKNLDGYKKEIVKADHYVAAILNVLKNLHIENNTLLLLFSDHGCSLGERKGEKAYGVYLYDYTLKVFIYLINPVFSKGFVVNDLVRTIDILPTLMDVFRIKPMRAYLPPEGISLLPLLSGKEPEGRISFSETGGLGGPDPSPQKPNIKCIRTQDWKLIYNISRRTNELYDMKTDPCETKNRDDDDVDIKSYLWELLKAAGNLNQGIDYDS